MKLNLDISQFTIGLRLDEDNNFHIQFLPWLSLMFVKTDRKDFQDIALSAHQQALLEGRIRETIKKNNEDFKKEVEAKQRRDLLEYKRSLITTISLELMRESYCSTDTVERATLMANEIIKASHED